MENKEKILFTSESVTEGHPDKICDAISDAILDALIAQDPMSRVACETATTTGLVLVMGEITSKANIDIQSIVRETIREIGYTRGKFGFDADTCAVITALDKQSTDIAMGVDKALEQKENQMDEDELDSIGAGDQGIQFGYASNETEEYMPYAINMAHKLARQLTKVRKDGTLKYLRPDGKTQVTVEYDENGKPFRIDAVVCSTQHDPDVTQEQIHADIKKYVFDEIIPADMVDHIRASVITILMQIGKVFEASMWIGSSTCYNLGLPCKIVRSRKFRGDATLINITSKHDRYNREIYKAFIVGSDGLKYYVSPNCVQVDKDTISALLNRMTLKELVDILDESHFGHWNYAPYNRHLFHFIELIAKYTRGNEKIDLKEYKWGWQVEQEKEQEAA